MIARFETAATRAPTLIGLEHASLPLALSVTSVPIVGFAGIAENDGRRRFHARAAGIIGVSSRREVSRNRASKLVCTLFVRYSPIGERVAASSEGASDAVVRAVAPCDVTVN